jgi:hypothetical protein
MHLTLGILRDFWSLILAFGLYWSSGAISSRPSAGNANRWAAENDDE